MENLKVVLELAQTLVLVVNKAAVLGLALSVVWILQTIMRDHRWEGAYPFLGKFWLRAGVAMVGLGFAMDFLTLYKPSISELILNIGALIIMHLFRKQYKENGGESLPYLDILSRKKSNYEKDKA